MNAVNVKLVGNSVAIVKCGHDNHSLYNYEINSLRTSRNLEVTHSAQVIGHDFFYSVLVPKGLSEEDRIDVIYSAIQKVDKEETNDDQQWNMKFLITTLDHLYREYEEC